MLPAQLQIDLVVLIVGFRVTTILAVPTWTGFGVALRRVLNDPKRARIFNIVMAVLLVVSIVPMVI